MIVKLWRTFPKDGKSKKTNTVTDTIGKSKGRGKGMQINSKTPVIHASHKVDSDHRNNRNEHSRRLCSSPTFAALECGVPLVFNL